MASYIIDASVIIEYLVTGNYTGQAKRLFEQKAVLNSALRIGLSHQLAIYDAVYIALALRSALPFITLDQPQTRAAFAEDISLKPITDFD